MSGENEPGLDIAKHDANMEVKRADENGLVWYAPHEQPFKLAGFHWFDQDRVYRRFPVKPAKPLPEGVESLAWCAAGGQVKFSTDSDKIAVKVKLRGPGTMDHMPSTGMNGFDLYLGKPGEEAFYNVTRAACGVAEYSCELLSRAGRETLDCTLNFPLYNGVDEVLVGLRQGATIHEPPPYRMDKPVVVYGTSITQGGCASRPGMCFSNILARRLNVPFLNLGFSGSGRGEPEVAEAIAAIAAPSLFVLDYEANSNSEGLAKTMPDFIAILRAQHPKTPVLVVSKVRFAKESLKSEPGTRLARKDCKAFQKGLVKELRAAGDKHVHFLDGSKFFGKDYHECAVDGVHPTDLGFFKMAKGLEPAIAELLFG